MNERDATFTGGHLAIDALRPYLAHNIECDVGSGRQSDCGLQGVRQAYGVVSSDVAWVQESVEATEYEPLRGIQP